MARLFIAAWPPADVVAELMSLPRKDQRGVRFVPPDNWHVTLRFLGEADPREAIAALDDAPLPHADAVLGPGVDVLEERMIVVPVRGVEELAGSVSRATRDLGEPPGRRFVGHLTLARVKPRAHLPRVIGALVQTRFSVEEVALVRSFREPAGARYETLETWRTGSATGR